MNGIKDPATSGIQGCQNSCPTKRRPAAIVDNITAHLAFRLFIAYGQWVLGPARVVVDIASNTDHMTGKYMVGRIRIVGVAYFGVTGVANTRHVGCPQANGGGKRQVAAAVLRRDAGRNLILSKRAHGKQAQTDGQESVKLRHLEILEYPIRNLLRRCWRRFEPRSERSPGTAGQQHDPECEMASRPRPHHGSRYIGLPRANGFPRFLGKAPKFGWIPRGSWRYRRTHDIRKVVLPQRLGACSCLWLTYERGDG